MKLKRISQELVEDYNLNPYCTPLNDWRGYWFSIDVRRLNRELARVRRRQVKRLRRQGRLDLL